MKFYNFLANFAASGAPSKNCDALPSFAVIDCSEDLCVQVTFSDGSREMINAEQTIRDGVKIDDVFKASFIFVQHLRGF